MSSPMSQICRMALYFSTLHVRRGRKVSGQGVGPGRGFPLGGRNMFVGLIPDVARVFALQIGYGIKL